MRKKIIISAVILLFIIAVTAIATIYNLKQKQKNISTTQEQAAQSESEKIVEEKNFLNSTGSSSCDSAGDETKVKDCFNTLNSAMNSTSTNACEGLPNEQDKMICQKAVFIQDVAVSGELSKCDEITNEINKIICVSQASLSLAIAKNDKKYCDNMAYSDDKISCIKTLDDMNKVSSTTADKVK